MKTLRSMTVINVRDVRAAAAFYEKLGFHCHGFFGEPADFGVTQRGDVTLGLHLADPGPIPVNRGMAMYVYVDDVGSMHGEAEADGLSPSVLCDQPYGCRDFFLKDPDGHEIGFGQDLTDNPNGPGLGPERGRG